MKPLSEVVVVLPIKYNFHIPLTTFLWKYGIVTEDWPKKFFIICYIDSSIKKCQTIYQHWKKKDGFIVFFTSVVHLNCQNILKKYKKGWLFALNPLFCMRHHWHSGILRRQLLAHRKTRPNILLLVYIKIILMKNLQKVLTN